jgi:hypothetical protein
MTVHYDYKKIVPGGWNPPSYKNICICKFCNKSVTAESEIYKKYKCCITCYERTKDYKD